jgi:acetyl-CoA decarbonylase/synthase complex subunit delta
MTVNIPAESWKGTVRPVTFGATEAEGGTRSNTITVGGETALPFLRYDGDMPYRPVLGLEISDRRPADWSPLLTKAWDEVMDSPADWAKAAEEAGADFIYMVLSLTDEEGNPNTPDYARAAVRQVLEATGLPLAVIGPGQAEADNELLVPVAEEGKGERLILGLCEEGNYRTIVAAALANDHVVESATPMDVNLAKQLVILIHDMGLDLDNILIDPTTGALGYGIEYGYSVMERLRLAALQGDAMTQLPMLVNVGSETWKVKEAKVGEGVPEEWGDWEKRALEWETLTAVPLIHAGADLVVLRHPDSLRRVRSMVDELAQPMEMA